MAIALCAGFGIFELLKLFTLTPKIALPASGVGAIVSWFYLWKEWEDLISKYADPVEWGLVLLPLAAVLVCAFALYFKPKLSP